MDGPEDYYRIKYPERRTWIGTGWPDGVEGKWNKPNKPPVQAAKKQTAASKRKQKLISEFEGEDPCCGYCGILLNSTTATIDHILPKSMFGTNDNSNLVLACRTCNTLKAASIWTVKYGPKKGSTGKPILS